MVQTIQQVLSVKEAIESRHSIRQYVQEPIPKEHIEEILELVRLAPSAWNLQPWRIHVITDHDLKMKMEEAAYGQKQVSSAPAVFIVSSDMEDVITNLEETVHPGLPPERKEEEVANLSQFFGGLSVAERGQWGLTQTNIALGFMLVSVQGLGYSSVPMLGFDQVKVRELLGLPEHVFFAAMVPVGKADGEGYPHHRHSLNRFVTFH
jgi:nitroreductase